jgi:hypothetical protein
MVCFFQQKALLVKLIHTFWNTFKNQWIWVNSDLNFSIFFVRFTSGGRI